MDIKQITKAICAPSDAVDMAPRIATARKLYSCEERTVTIRLEGGPLQRTIRSLKMPPLVCGDWAGLVWGENARVTAGEDDSPESELLERYLGEKFHPIFSAFLESNVFGNHIGALEVLPAGIRLRNDGTADTSSATFSVETVPAEAVIPMKWNQREVTECAFASKPNKTTLDVRVHRSTPNGASIENLRFRTSDGWKNAKQIPAEELIALGIAPYIEFQGAPQLFAVVRSGLANRADASSPFGWPVTEGAADAFETLDDVYDNFGQDIGLSGKMLFFDEDLLRKDANGNAIPPSDDKRQLFRLTKPSTPGLDGESSIGIHEYNPQMRVTENTEALETSLGLVSFLVGMGPGRYRYREGSVMTATQVISENSELFRNRKRHLNSIKEALTTIARAVLWCGSQWVGGIDPNAEIAITTDDSVIEDDESRDRRWLAKYNQGGCSLYTYLTEGRKLTEEQARAEIAEIRGERAAPTLFEE